MSLSNLVIIGQFIPLDTPVHRMDPRVKLLLSLVLLIFIFIIPTMLGLGAIFLVIVVSLACAKVPFMHLVRGLRPILFLIILTVLIQIFATTGNVAVQFWGIKITYEGLWTAAFVVTRLILLVSISVILTFATSPLDLTFAMECYMLPLKKIKFPASEIALMMSIALRFIPTLMEETEKIIKAQSSRGADFTSGGIISRAKSFVPVLIPLFVSAFRRAEDLADAMESRCFITGGNRSRLHVAKISMLDISVLIFFILVMVAVYLYAWI